MFKQDLLPPAATAMASGIMAALVFYAGSKYGPGLTFDSVNYIYAGNSLFEKGQILRPFQTPFIEWPPLYPVLIAGLISLSGNVLHNIFYFQIIVASLSVGLACVLAQKLISHRLLLIATYISLAFATPLVLVNHFVWSESFFVLLIVLQIYLFMHYITGPGKYIWILLVINGMLLCLQRQVGAFFVAGGACILLIYPDKYPFRKRIASSLVYILLSIIPLFLWWIRNYRIRGLIMNDYRDTVFFTPFTSHWSVYNDIFTSWFLPDEVSLWMRVIIIYGSLIGLAMVYIRSQNKPVFQQHTVVVLSILFCSYFILLFIISFTVAEPIDDRKLAPVYIPGMLLFFSMLDVLLMHMQDKRKIWILYACLLWGVYPVARTIYNAHMWHNSPRQAHSSQPFEDEFTDKLRF